jgi:hypothetical protein
VLVHRDDIARVANGDARRERGSEVPSQLLLAADENEIRLPATCPIQQRAPDDLVRGVVAAHGVDGDLHGDREVMRSSAWP